MDAYLNPIPGLEKPQGRLGKDALKREEKSEYYGNFA
jgi:hypothetical protein